MYWNEIYEKKLPLLYHLKQLTGMKIDNIFSSTLSLTIYSEEQIFNSIPCAIIRRRKTPQDCFLPVFLCPPLIKISSPTSPYSPPHLHQFPARAMGHKSTGHDGPHQGICTHRYHSSGNVPPRPRHHRQLWRSLGRRLYQPRPSGDGFLPHYLRLWRMVRLSAGWKGGRDKDLD